MCHRGLQLALGLGASALLGCSSPQADDRSPEGLPPPSARLTDFVPWEALPVPVVDVPGVEELQALLEPITVSDPGSVLPDAEAGDDPVSPPPTRGVPPTVEPDTVQQHADGLTMLRRGELASLYTSGGGLRVSGGVPHAPDANGERTTYRGLLQHGDRLMVVGHNPDRRALEVGLFDLRPGGELRYRDTVSLPVDEHEVGHTHRAWLSGDTLVLYSARWMHGNVFDAVTPLLGVEGRERIFTEPPPPRRVYRADRLAFHSDGSPGPPWLHTVTRCPVAQLPRGCRSEAVLGPATQHALHAGQSVYLTGWRQNDEQTLLRFPAEGTPQALRIFGWIDDQDVREHDGHFEAVVDTAVQPKGDASTHWYVASLPSPRMQLLRVPLEAFGGVGNRAPWDAYQRLPLPEGYGPVSAAHFAGDWLLYSGRPSGDGAPGPGSPTYAVHTGERTRQVVHDRPTTPTAAFGNTAILMSSVDSRSENPAVRFTRVDLSGMQPQAGAVYRLPGFNMGWGRGPVTTRLDGPETGVTGLPVVGANEGRQAGVLFVRHRGLELEPLGQLLFSPGLGGAPRTLFMGDRIFVTLEDELVEGRLRSGPQGEMIGEVARLNWLYPTPTRP